jgi:FKBP-type peptidyl-prolyl cis-trans isomerase SlyD
MNPAGALLAVALLVAAPVLAHAQTSPAGPPGAPVVEKGSTVKLEYTLKDDAGVVVDSNKGHDPLIYTQGSDEMFPELEKEITGMHVGEEKRVVLKPEQAFGLADPKAQAEVPKSMLPPEALNVGAHLMARNQAGEQRPVTVKDIKDQTVILDLNHPLAGKTVVFEIKVLAVDPPKVPDTPKVEAPTPRPAKPEPPPANSPKAEPKPN